MSLDLVTQTPVVRHYDPVTRWLHWLMAVQIIAQFVLALVWDDVGKDLGHSLVRLHVSLGVCLIATLVFRILWRSLWMRRPTETLPRAQAGIAHGIHHLLYTMMVVELVAGLSKRWDRGRTVDVFGLLHIPSPFAYAPALRPIISFTHEWLAWAIIVIAAGHGLMAVYHQLVLRDGVLRRMTG
ncbi:cytochrome b [Acidisoma silvae]|uniref:Cytochrome b n=1 Tax=Acidisoma silvae TaxID=2802396 RepID=A0A964DZ89_9PROT|nr:cytochrome b [Acidisoma silvae]MCB8876016.1 cytochrome b [Acidisoma silvae]